MVVKGLCLSVHVTCLLHEASSGGLQGLPPSVHSYLFSIFHSIRMITESPQAVQYFYGQYGRLVWTLYTQEYALC